MRGCQSEDGRWSLQNAYKGKTYFALERVGMPSRWNTLRALRVLGWWDQARRDTSKAAEQMRCTERERAKAVGNSEATGRPRRSVLSLGRIL